MHCLPARSTGYLHLPRSGTSWSDDTSSAPTTFNLAEMLEVVSSISCELFSNVATYFSALRGFGFIFTGYLSVSDFLVVDTTSSSNVTHSYVLSSLGQCCINMPREHDL